MTITVNTTKTDIRRGVPGCVTKDAVSMAMRRAGLVDPYVNRSFLTFHAYGKPVIVLTPPELRDFIDRYDAGKRVKPMRFMLNIPAQIKFTLAA